MNKKKEAFIILLLAAGMYIFSGCAAEAAKNSKVEQTESAQVSEVQSAEEVKLPMEGKKLFIYSGAGMKKPVAEIADAFQKETGAVVEVTYGNAAQIISQITASNEGDLFIAGDQGELTKIKEKYVAAEKPLVKHIPVIAVPKGNPKGIQGLAGFAKNGVNVVLGDNKATPIGKLADKALEDAGLLDQVNIKARSATAPEIINALSLGECDAAIVWRENAKAEGIEIVESSDMEKYIKVVPAATLKCAANGEVLEVFMTYLSTDAAKTIWQKNGYEIIQ